MLAGMLAWVSGRRAGAVAWQRGLLVGRRRASLLVVLACVLVVLLGVWCAGQRRAAGVDVPADRWLIAHLGTGWVIRAFADAGNTVPVIVAVVVIAVVAWRWRPRVSVLAVVAPLVAVLLTEVLVKPLVDRRLAGTLVYPSGHQAVVTSVLTVLLIVVSGVPLRRRLRWVVVALLGLLALAVAAALVAAGYHYLTDTVGGLGVGVLSALLGALAVDAGGDALASRSRRTRR